MFRKLPSYSFTSEELTKLWDYRGTDYFLKNLLVSQLAHQSFQLIQYFLNIQTLSGQIALCSKEVPLYSDVQVKDTNFREMHSASFSYYFYTLYYTSQQVWRISKKIPRNVILANFYRLNFENFLGEHALISHLRKS